MRNARRAGISRKRGYNGGVVHYITESTSPHLPRPQRSPLLFSENLSAGIATVETQARLVAAAEVFQPVLSLAIECTHGSPRSSQFKSIILTKVLRKLGGAFTPTSSTSDSTPVLDIISPPSESHPAPLVTSETIFQASSSKTDPSISVRSRADFYS